MTILTLYRRGPHWHCHSSTELLRHLGLDRGPAGVPDSASAEEARRAVERCNPKCVVRIEENGS